MRIHFIGIGGIGVSALAQYYIAKGYQVSGCDLQTSETIEFLRSKGAEIFIGKHPPELKDNDKEFRIIYSPAVPPENEELHFARQYHISCKSYPEVLGNLTRKYFTIAVSGTHGKSTTTALVALTLLKAGLDPTVFVGTKLREFGWSNFRLGNSKYLVIEADEHFASFLHYYPRIIVITNIDKDHLDYYKNLKHIIRAFSEFATHLPKDGLLVTNADDKNSQFVIQNSKLQCKVQSYSGKQPEASKVRKLLQIPGNHNISNALAVLSVARSLGIPDNLSLKALSEYRGSWRRFEIVHQTPILTVISDYAHHPEEIKATIRAAREKFPKQKMWIVFQPHQAARTALLFDEFIKALEAADALVVTKIFEVPGRERKKISPHKDAYALASQLQKRKEEVYFIPDFRNIPALLTKKIKEKSVILIMGAGDIYRIAAPQWWAKRI